MGNSRKPGRWPVQRFTSLDDPTDRALAAEAARRAEGTGREPSVAALIRDYIVRGLETDGVTDPGLTETNTTPFDLGGATPEGLTTSVNNTGHPITAHTP